MIATAIQRGSLVYAYNEKGALLCNVSGELYGFTGSTISVRRGSMIYVYNEKGSLLSSKSAR